MHIKSVEAVVDLLIVITIFFFFSFSVRDPLKEDLKNIDKWAFTSLVLVFLFFLYFCVRSYIYYHWVIRGFQPNLLNVDLYSGRKLQPLALDLDYDPTFYELDQYKKKTQKWRVSVNQKRRYWFNKRLIDKRFKGGYAWSEEIQLSPRQKWRQNWMRRRRKKITRWRLHRFKRRLKRRFRKGDKYFRWSKRKKND